MTAEPQADAERVKAFSVAFVRISSWDARSGKNGLTMEEIQALERKREIWLYEEYSEWWSGHTWGGHATDLRWRGTWK